MNEIDLKQVDLNLLVSLRALLDEHSVTRAAQQMGVGQSAMSYTLGRLRELLDDPLFVRVGRTLEPTPRALALEAPVRRLLREVQDVLATHHDFEPATSERRFSVICPDAFGGFLPVLLEHFSQLAPGIELNFFWPQRDPAEALRDHIADLALVGPHAEVSGVIRQGLGALDWAIAMRKDHPAADGDFTVEKWLAYPHITVRTGSRSTSLIELALERAGLQRKVGVVLQSFMTPPFVAARTNFLYAMPRVLVRPLVDSLGLTLREPPLELEPVHAAALWPERLSADPAHAWFREEVVRTMRAHL